MLDCAHCTSCRLILLYAYVVDVVRDALHRCLLGPDQFCSRLFDILRQNFAALPTIFCLAMLRFTDILLEFCSPLLRFVGTLPDAMASTRRSVYIRVRVVDL